MILLLTAEQIFVKELIEKEGNFFLFYPNDPKFSDR